MIAEEFIKQFCKDDAVLGSDKKKKIIKASLEAVDKTTESMIIMEELAELSQQVSKGARDDTNNNDHWFNLLEEMADVSICLEFLKIIYNISDYNLELAKSIKLRREAERRGMEV